MKIDHKFLTQREKGNPNHFRSSCSNISRHAENFNYRFSESHSTETVVVRLFRYVFFRETDLFLWVLGLHLVNFPRICRPLVRRLGDLINIWKQQELFSRESLEQALKWAFSHWSDNPLERGNQSLCTLKPLPVSPVLNIPWSRFFFSTNPAAIHAKAIRRANGKWDHWDSCD